MELWYQIVMNDGCIDKSICSVLKEEADLDKFGILFRDNTYLVY